ncbi:MAG: cytochrome c maturation protein CcmE [Sandaracinaceae bacterium]|nr:cytochrome c maturation protein CcmE [Sandaracinaceae bacterium]MBK7776430.1 cytochrome c maturation protein CcmE [Sandaracinaceae bacterium]MBK8408564.1 cytochrome c maturation protein CcmE [Sandaracinaceae bacterium]MBK8590902.1 cytochrome c maturation protein CcmE [Sandaracinaceae bacterium]
MCDVLWFVAVAVAVADNAHDDDNDNVDTPSWQPSRNEAGIVCRATPYSGEMSGHDQSDLESAPEPTSPAPVPPSAGSSPQAASKPRGLGSGAKIIAVFGLLGAAMLVLAFSQASEVATYSVTVSEALAGAQGDRRIRVEGDLRHGSIQFRESPCEWRFTIERDGHEMPVEFPRCVVPDTFRDDYDIQVVVEGRVDERGTFLADQIIPRCPSKYEEQATQLSAAGG